MNDTIKLLSFMHKLEMRLLELRMSLKYGNLEDAKIALKKCEAFRENIESLMQLQGIDKSMFMHERQNIDEAIIDIEAEIKRINNVWWRRALKEIKSLIISIFDPLSRLRIEHKDKDE